MNQNGHGATEPQSTHAPMSECNNVITALPNQLELAGAAISSLPSYSASSIASSSIGSCCTLSSNIIIGTEQLEEHAADVALNSIHEHVLLTSPIPTMRVYFSGANATRVQDLRRLAKVGGLDKYKCPQWTPHERSLWQALVRACSSPTRIVINPACAQLLGISGLNSSMIMHNWPYLWWLTGTSRRRRIMKHINAVLKHQHEQIFSVHVQRLVQLGHFSSNQYTTDSRAASCVDATSSCVDARSCVDGTSCVDARSCVDGTSSCVDADSQYHTMESIENKHTARYDPISRATSISSVHSTSTDDDTVQELSRCSSDRISCNCTIQDCIHRNNSRRLLRNEDGPSRRTASLDGFDSVCGISELHSFGPGEDIKRTHSERIRSHRISKKRDQSDNASVCSQSSKRNRTRTIDPDDVPLQYYDNSSQHSCQINNTNTKKQTHGDESSICSLVSARIRSEGISMSLFETSKFSISTLQEAVKYEFRHDGSLQSATSFFMSPENVQSAFVQDLKANVI